MARDLRPGQRSEDDPPPGIPAGERGQHRHPEARAHHGRQRRGVVHGQSRPADGPLHRRDRQAGGERVGDRRRALQRLPAERAGRRQRMPGAERQAEPVGHQAGHGDPGLGRGVGDDAEIDPAARDLAPDGRTAHVADLEPGIRRAGRDVERQPRPHPGRDRGHRGNAHFARAPGGVIGQPARPAVELGERILGKLERSRAEGGEPALALADDQRLAEARLELAQGHRHGRGRAVQPHRRARQAAGPGDRHEDAQGLDLQRVANADTRSREFGLTVASSPRTLTSKEGDAWR